MQCALTSLLRYTWLQTVHTYLCPVEPANRSLRRRAERGTAGNMGRNDRNGDDGDSSIVGGRGRSSSALLHLLSPPSSSHSSSCYPFPQRPWLSEGKGAAAANLMATANTKSGGDGGPKKGSNKVGNKKLFHDIPLMLIIKLVKLGTLRYMFCNLPSIMPLDVSVRTTCTARYMLC